MSFGIRSRRDFTSSGWVLDLAASPSNLFIASAHASGVIHILDSNTLNPTAVTIHPLSPDSVISEIRYASPEGAGDSMLWRCCKDGRLDLLDLRTGAIAMALKAEAPLLSFSSNCSNTVVAAGTELVERPREEDEAKLLFWLVNVFNMSTLEEEDALHQVIKTDSVHKVGFFGPSSEYLFCQTHVETFGIYAIESGDTISVYGDVRERGSGPLHQVDYLVDTYYLADEGRLYLVTGTRT
ncbi:WD repeat-containing protein 89 [Irineochytrium annulatum]|nr:WD repeat-containing protein 89 [Irineochytrium annulatum]